MQGAFDFSSKNDEAILLRLYQEQDTILWAHKVPVRPALIRLTDAISHWGRWHAQTRTIELARKLVREHSWFDVCSVLRHEMAHQLATEHFRVEMGGHDDVFRECCQWLGVPVGFAKASVTLGARGFDWRSGSPDPDQEKLLSKVRKLLALATSSNEHESLLAMQKVRELYARHNLEEAARQRTDGESKDMVQLSIATRKKRLESHHAKVLGILVGHFFVRVIMTGEYDYGSRDEFRAFQIIGTRQNVLMAEYVYYFLMQQVEFLLGEHKKTVGPLSRLEANSYRIGVLQGFQEKLEATDREVKTRLEPQAESASLTVDKALIPVGKDLEAYVKRAFPRLRTSGGSRGFLDDHAFSAGHSEGKRLTLRKGVAESGGRSGRFLTQK